MSEEQKVVSSDGNLRVHLVLSAGGMKCISYAGAVEALVENGFSFESVTGASAGSLIGGILCSEVGLEGFKKAVYELDASRLGEGTSWLPFPLGLLRKPFAKYKESRVAEVFKEIVNGKPKFRDFKNPQFATFAVDLRSHKIHVFSTRATPDMFVAEALRFSTAVPFMFPLQEMEENLLVDGAVVSQSPAWLATVYNDGLPILVLRPKKNPARPAPNKAFEYLTSIIDLGGGSRDYYMINQMPHALMIEIDPGDVVYDQFSLSQDERKSLVKSGRVAVEDRLRDLHALVRGIPMTVKEEKAGKRPSEIGAIEAIETSFPALPVKLDQSLKRDQIFISYSHKDREWMERFQTTLNSLTWNHRLKSWDDTQIPHGANWLAEIKRALAATKVAVLLITTNYLVSDFVRKVELQEFLRTAAAGGLTIVPVIVGPAGYEESPLSEFQAVNALNMPLNMLGEAQRDMAVLNICRDIKKDLDS